MIEKALRERHPKNAGENWLHGASIALVAWAYRPDAAHRGPIDAAHKATTRRERIGHLVIAALGKKCGRAIQPPDCL